MSFVEPSGFETNIPSAEAERQQIENAKTECQQECQTLSTTVETHQKFLNYAQNFESQFGKENLEIIAKVLSDFQQVECPDDDLCAFPPEDVLELIQAEVESQIKDSKKIEKKSEQAQVEKDLDNRNLESSQTIQKLTIKDNELATAEDMLSKENKGKKLDEATLKDEVFSDIGPKNIAGLKQGVQQQHKQGEISQTILDQALTFIAEHEATLQSFRQFFKPEEQTVFNTIVTNSKLNLSANSNAEIYADVFAQIDAGIADEDRKKTLKNEIADKLGIDHPDIETGGDLQQALRTPSGDGGVFYSSEKPLHVRPGVSAFVGENDRSFVKAKIPGRADRSFDITGWPPDRVTELTNFLNFYVLSEKAGISSFLEQAFDINFALVDDFDYQKSIEIRQTIEAMLGFNKGYNGRIIGEPEIAMLIWQMQILSDKGDATQDDHNIENARARLENLGVRDSSGKIDFEVLQAIGSYTREIYMTGVPDYYQLQTHLHNLFPSRVPLTGENKEKEEV